jgi:hypothetical protein
LLPPYNEVGDAVCAVEGASALFTLRSGYGPRQQQYRPFGENFLLRMMNGEYLPAGDLWSFIQVLSAVAEIEDCA